MRIEARKSSILPFAETPSMSHRSSMCTALDEPYELALGGEYCPSYKPNRTVCLRSGTRSGPNKIDFMNPRSIE